MRGGADARWMMNRTIILGAAIVTALLLAAPMAKAEVQPVKTSAGVATAGVEPTLEPGQPESADREAPSQDPLRIDWQVIASGGRRGSCASYISNGTVGQLVVGSGASADFRLSHGYWHSFDRTCCRHRGNADGVAGAGGPVDVADLTFLVAYLFLSGPAPPCLDEANADGVTGAGGPVDVADLTFLVAYLFLGGPPPPNC